MKDELFNEFMQSVSESIAISKGKMKPSRVFRVEPTDVAAIREKTNKTQIDFANMIGVSVGTLRNWEQGRRKPTGSALALLKVVDANPQYVASVLKI